MTPALHALHLSRRRLMLDGMALLPIAVLVAAAVFSILNGGVS